MSRRLKSVALVVLFAPWGACVLGASACGNGDDRSGLPLADATTADAEAADGAAAPDAGDSSVAVDARDGRTADGEGPEGSASAVDAGDSGESDGPDPADSSESVLNPDAAEEADSSDAIAVGDSGSGDGAVDDADTGDAAHSDGTASGGPACPYSATANACAGCTTSFCDQLFPCMANATCAPALAQFAACIDSIDAGCILSAQNPTGLDGCVPVSSCSLPPLAPYLPDTCDSSDCVDVANGLSEFQRNASIFCAEVCAGTFR